MALPEFHLTSMGRTFYEYTMPALVKQLQRLNDNIEKMLAQRAEEAAKQPPEKAP